MGSFFICLIFLFGCSLSESIYAQSRADFVNKLSIALKEASETEYWLELLHDSGYLTDKTHLRDLFDKANSNDVKDQFGPLIPGLFD